MYSNKILTQNLINDIKNITKVDTNKYDPLFLTSNLFGLVSFMSLNKVYLSINQKEETTTNCMFVNVGKSGAGKTNSNNLILKPLKDVEERNFQFNEKIKKFCISCKELAGDLHYTNVLCNTGEEDERTEFVDNYYKKNFQDDPYINRDDLFFTTNPAELYKPQYIATIFTEEGLRKGFKNTANSTLLLNSPELEILFENLGRTSVSNNPHTTLIDLIDGFKGVKLLVGGNDYETGKVVVITSTIHSKIEKYKKSFFDQTTAYRSFFIIGDNSQTNFFETRLGHFNGTTDIHHIKMFEARIQKLTEMLLAELGESDELIKIDINTPDLFELVKTELQKIRSEYFQEDKIEYIDNDIIEGISNRCEFKLLQTILITHILNISYNNILEPSGSLKNKLLDINKDSILRGVECFRYFLTNMFSLLETNIKNDLNETQQFIVNGLSEGDQMLLDEFIVKIESTGYRNKNGAFKKVSRKTIQVFLSSDKSKPYFEIYQGKVGAKTIKRKVGVS